MMKRTLLCLYLQLISLFVSSITSQSCGNGHCSLLDSLLSSSNYSVATRPVCQEEPFVNVTLELVYRQVMDLYWRDCRLVWNTNEHNDIQKVFAPFDQIWTPDLTLFDDTAFGMNIAFSERKYFPLSVTNEGQVMQLFPSVLSSICGVDATYFPFDVQQCPLRFGNWIYDDTQVNITSELAADTSSYIESAEWTLDAITVKKTPTVYKTGTFSSITYTVTIRRRPTFFMLTLFFPCFVICTMAILGFFLPPASGEKVGLQVTLLLALTVFQFLTLDMLPPNSKPLPLMCVYFALVMALASLSCILSVVVIKIHAKGQQGWKVPERLRTILIERMGRLLMVKRPHVLRAAEAEVRHFDSGSITKRISARETTGENGSPEEGPAEATLKQISARLGKLLDLVQEDKATQDSIEYADWLTIASILDRLFLIFYVTLSLVVGLVFAIKIAS